MADYVPYTWEDRVVEHPRNYIMQDNGDGTITLIPAPGTVYNEGTKVTAARMNQIEQGIAGSLQKSGGTMTGQINFKTPSVPIIFTESDQTLPNGKWRVAVDANTWRIDKNTAAAGDFSSFDRVIEVTSSSVLRTNGNDVWHRGDLRWNPAGYLEYNDGGAWRPVSGIKSVQRGVSTFSSSSNTLNVTINAVNLNKSWVNISSKTNQTTGNASQTHVMARLTSSTNLELSLGGPYDGTTVSWEVIESY